MLRNISKKLNYKLGKSNFMLLKVTVQIFIFSSFTFLSFHFASTYKDHYTPFLSESISRMCFEIQSIPSYKVQLQAFEIQLIPFSIHHSAPPFSLSKHLFFVYAYSLMKHYTRFSRACHFSLRFCIAYFQYDMLVNYITS